MRSTPACFSVSILSSSIRPKEQQILMSTRLLMSRTTFDSSLISFSVGGRVANRLHLFARENFAAQRFFRHAVEVHSSSSCVSRFYHAAERRATKVVSGSAGLDGRLFGLLEIHLARSEQGDFFHGKE